MRTGPIQLTKTVGVLAAVILAVFIVQQSWDRFFEGSLLTILALIPAYGVGKGWIWQWITYGFLHGDVLHLFFNLMMLLMIGSEVDRNIGRTRFLWTFFLSLLGSAITYLVIQGIFFSEQGLRPMVGASGAIYALLVIFGTLFRDQTLLFMMIFPLKAQHFVWVLLGLEFMMTVFSSHTSALSSISHLGGMGVGFLLVWYWKRPPTVKSKKPGHLKLVKTQTWH